ncbi:MAG: hypothetical protein EOO77_29560, partial [Oxalobacteraceae bacterium]
MIRNFCLAVAAALTIAATPVAAETITFSGVGTVSEATGTLTPTGSAGPGSSFDFSFDFDTDAARLYSIDETAAYYDLPLSAFSATLGSYAFALSDDPFFVPTVELYNAFSFFGGNSSEAVLVANLYLAGTIKPSGTTASPFPIAPGAYDTLVLSAVFRTGDMQVPLGFEQFRDPSLAATRDFTYTVSDRPNRKFGRLSGNYDGGFSAAAAVPEPATWLMMLL